MGLSKKELCAIEVFNKDISKLDATPKEKVVMTDNFVSTLREKRKEKK